MCTNLIHDSSEDKKAKGTKKCVKERKLQFQNYKTRLEATQLEKKIKHLEKNKTDIGSIKKIIRNS